MNNSASLYLMLLLDQASCFIIYPCQSCFSINHGPHTCVHCAGCWISLPGPFHCPVMVTDWRGNPIDKTRTIGVINLFYVVSNTYMGDQSPSNTTSRIQHHIFSPKLTHILAHTNHMWPWCMRYGHFLSLLVLSLSYVCIQAKGLSCCDDPGCLNHPPRSLGPLLAPISQVLKQMQVTRLVVGMPPICVWLADVFSNLFALKWDHMYAFGGPCLVVLFPSQILPFIAIEPKKAYASGRGVQAKGVRVKDVAGIKVHTENAGQAEATGTLVGPGGESVFHHRIVIPIQCWL